MLDEEMCVKVIRFLLGLLVFLVGFGLLGLRILHRRSGFCLRTMMRGREALGWTRTKRKGGVGWNWSAVVFHMVVKSFNSDGE